MKKELLEKYLKNNCTYEEFEELVGWVNTDAQDNESKNWGYEQWEMLELDQKKKDEKKFKTLLFKIHYEINLKHRKDQDRKIIGLSRFVNWLSRAAAILFVPLFGVVLYLLASNNFQTGKYANFPSTDSLEVIAPPGSKTVVLLSDGSEVQLNYGSKIKYPHFFSDNQREVRLSGEGFFKVAHNPKKPFVVKAGPLNVKAIGTTFNVLAYADNGVIETTLVSGKVILEKVKKDGEIINIGTMKPGLHVNYDLQSGSVTRTEGSVEKYISWTEGKLIFEDTPISQVTDRLGRIFNVDFEVKDEVKDYIYTVTFSNEQLYQILDLMTIVTPISYKILPRQKLPDGTFLKQKIIIQKRQ